MRNVKRGEGLSHLQNPGENDSSGGGSHPKPSRTSCPIDGILTWTRGTLWHFAPRAARESYKIIRRFVLDGAKDRVKPEWSEHRHRRKAPLVEAGGRRGRVARPDAMRNPRPFKNDCKRQQTQKKQKSNQLQLQVQHQREMINSDGREGNVWACSYGPDWREPPWVVHLLPGPSAPRACWYACIGWCRKVE